MILLAVGLAAGFVLGATYAAGRAAERNYAPWVVQFRKQWEANE